MPAKFGEIVVDLGYVTEAQLEEAIALQRQGRAKLGQIMVYLRILTDEQVQQVIEHQQKDGHGKRFGQCALEMQLITERERAEAVRYQTTSKGVLGEILIELGYLNEEQRDRVMRMQYGA